MELAHRIMQKGLEEKIFTGAVLLVERRGEVLFHEAYGTLGGPGTRATTRGTLFDMASLTKVLATTPCWMILESTKRGILDRPARSWFPYAPPDKGAITPRQLLAHAAGLPAWRPYYLMWFEEPRFGSLVNRILSEALEYMPGKGCVYSDLGFLLLRAMIERETGIALDRFARKEIFEPLGIADDLTFLPDHGRDEIALTRIGEPGGLVHDLNTRALGGVSGHAGLFGTASGVGTVAGEILKSCISRKGFFDRDLARIFCSRAGFTASSTRALGFDTPSTEGSSCGRFFSAQSVGHTGFTGTSVWVDLDAQVTVILLTNRVVMGESDQRIKDFRPRIHDSVRSSIRP